MNTRGQLALMRLASPALPIGGFSYSQGLESAIEAGWVADTDSLIQWLLDCLQLNVGHYEAPMVLAMATAVSRADQTLARELNDDYLASRETAELHAESCQMGYSLLRLLAALEPAGPAPIDTAFNTAMPARALAWLDADELACLPLAWSMAACHFGLMPTQCLNAYLWAWLENQVAAAIKAVPLGQQAGQRVFDRVQPALAETLDAAASAGRDGLRRQADFIGLSNFAPGLAIASSWHETQYTRLFRS